MAEVLRCGECGESLELGHDCLAVPVQEPERSGLADGESWWEVLDRAEHAEARVVQLERALREILALDKHVERLGFAQGIARRGLE